MLCQCADVRVDVDADADVAVLLLLLLLSLLLLLFVLSQWNVVDTDAGESQHGLLVVPVISMHVAACNV